jgi:uncharacterized protein YdaU (DUF1376 family)
MVMSLPYFPMFPTDFEAKTSHLTLAEDGAYNRLLRLMWMMPGCTLPADDAWLMRRMRVDQETFDTVVRVVIDEFFTNENGRLSNAKLGRIFVETNEAHQKRVLAGAKGGKSKALKTKETAPSNAVAKPKQPEPEPEPDEVEDKSSTSQEAADYQRYLKAHPKPVESDAGAARFSALLADGIEADRIIAAAVAYAETVKTWSGEAKVQQSDNFLCPERGQWKKYHPKPQAVVSSQADILAFWAEKINGTGFVAACSINAGTARALLEARLVTPEKLKERGIAA